MYVIIRDTFDTFAGSLGMLLEGKGKIPTRAHDTGRATWRVMIYL